MNQKTSTAVAQIRHAAIAQAAATAKSLRPAQIARLLGIANSTLYHWLATRDDMPKLRRLSARCVVGDRDEWLAWRDSH
jgi:predicted DNA-binding transcriptional regulator AlpA